MIGETADDLGVFFILCHRQTTHARHDQVRDIRGEAADVAEGARGLATVIHTDGFAAVFDDPQIMLLCDGEDRIHVRNLTEEMDRHDRAGLLRDLHFDFCRINVVRFWITVDEHRHEIMLKDDVRSCDERQRGDEDLITILPSSGFLQARHSNTQRIRSTVHEDRIGASVHLREALLELADERTVGEAVALEHLHHVCLLPGGQFQRADAELGGMALHMATIVAFTRENICYHRPLYGAKARHQRRREYRRVDSRPDGRCDVQRRTHTRCCCHS